LAVDCHFGSSAGFNLKSGAKIHPRGTTFGTTLKPLLDKDLRQITL